MSRREGQVVAYTHPAWGDCRGLVLVATPSRLLVQDLAPTGAREWVPLAWLNVEHRPQGAQ